jgi:hypothetical protein
MHIYAKRSRPDAPNPEPFSERGTTGRTIHDVYRTRKDCARRAGSSSYCAIMGREINVKTPCDPCHSLAALCRLPGRGVRVDLGFVARSDPPPSAALSYYSKPCLHGTATLQPRFDGSREESERRLHRRERGRGGEGLRKPGRLGTAQAHIRPWPPCRKRPSRTVLEGSREPRQVRAHLLDAGERKGARRPRRPEVRSDRFRP